MTSATASKHRKFAHGRPKDGIRSWGERLIYGSQNPARILLSELALVEQPNSCGINLYLLVRCDGTATAQQAAAKLSSPIETW